MKRNKNKNFLGSDIAYRSTVTQSVKEDVTTQSVVTSNIWPTCIKVSLLTKLFFGNRNKDNGKY